MGIEADAERMAELAQAQDQAVREGDALVGRIGRHAGTFAGQADLLHSCAVVRGAIVPYAAAR